MSSPTVPSWQDVESDERFASLDAAGKSEVFSKWQDDAVTEMLTLGSPVEELDKFTNSALQTQFRLNNPDVDPSKDKDKWTAFVDDHNTRLNDRFKKAAPVWKDMWSREDAPTSTVTEDGSLVVNPKLLGNDDAYRSAVMEADAPPTAKAEAIREQKYWQGMADQTALAELMDILDEHNTKVSGKPIEPTTYSTIRFQQYPNGDIYGIYDPRQEPGVTDYIFKRTEDILPTGGPQFSEKLYRWSEKARTSGVSPQEVLDRWKTYTVWGAATDEGNLVRKDPKTGSVIVNDRPRTEDSKQLDLPTLWDKRMYDAEADRLKLTDQERTQMEAQRKEAMSKSAPEVHQLLMRSGMRDAGGVATALQGRDVRDFSADVLGIEDKRERADYQAFVASQPKDTPVEEMVGAYLNTKQGRSNFAKAVDKYQTAIIGGAAELEAQAGELVGLGVTAAVNAPTAHRIFERSQRIREQVSAAESVNGQAPLVKGLTTEAGWMALTWGAGEVISAAARPLARAAIASAELGAEGGALSRTLARASEEYAKLLPETQGFVAKINGLAPEVVARTEGGRVSAALAELSAEHAARLEAKVAAEIGTLGTTGVVYGTAGARSAAGVYSDAYSTYYQKAKEQGLSHADATRLSATQAWKPAVAAGVATMVFMKLVPGGTEKIFGIQKGAEDASHMTVRQFFGQVTEKGLRQALRTPGFKKAAAVMAGGFVADGGKEILEEDLDESFQALIAMQTYNPDMTIGDALKNIEQATYLAGFMGSGANILTSSFDKGDPKVVEGFKTAPPAQTATPNVAPPPATPGAAPTTSTAPSGGSAPTTSTAPSGGSAPVAPITSPEGGPPSPEAEDQATVAEAEAAARAGELPEGATPAPNVAPPPAPVAVNETPVGETQTDLSNTGETQTPAPAIPPAPAAPAPATPVTSSAPKAAVPTDSLPQGPGPAPASSPGAGQQPAMSSRAAAVESLRQSDPKAAGRLQRHLDDNKEVFDELEASGVTIEYHKDRASFEAAYPNYPGRAKRNTQPVANAFVRSDGSIGITIFAGATFRNSAGFKAAIGHEVRHVAQYRFEQTEEGKSALAGSVSLFNKDSSDFDSKLDAFMRKEYPSWDKLSAESKVREAARAIMEGRAEGKTSHFKPGIFSYIKSFLSHVGTILKDGTPMRAYVDGATAAMPEALKRQIEKSSAPTATPAPAASAAQTTTPSAAPSPTPREQVAQKFAADHGQIAPAVTAAIEQIAAQQPAPETPSQGTPETGAQEKRGGKDSGKVPDVTARVKGSALDPVTLEGDLEYSIKPDRVEKGQLVYRVWGNDISEAAAIELKQIDLLDPLTVAKALTAADTEGKAADVRTKQSPAPAPEAKTTPEPTAPNGKKRQGDEAEVLKPKQPAGGRVAASPAAPGAEPEVAILDSDEISTATTYEEAVSLAATLKKGDSLIHPRGKRALTLIEDATPDGKARVTKDDIFRRDLGTYLLPRPSLEMNRVTGEFGGVSDVYLIRRATPKKEPKPKPKAKKITPEEKAAKRSALVRDAVNFFLRQRAIPTKQAAIRDAIKAAFPQQYEAAPLTTSELKAVADQVAEKAPSEGWDPKNQGENKFTEADKQATNKSRDARMQGKDAFTRFMERATRLLNDTASIPYEHTGDVRKAEQMLVKAMASLESMIESSIRAELLRPDDAEVVRAVVAAYIQRDFARLMFARQLEANTTGLDRDAKVELALQTLGFDPELEDSEGSPQAQAEKAVDKWGKIKINETTVKRFLANEQANMHKANEARKEAGNKATSLDDEVGGGGESESATRGDFVADTKAETALDVAERNDQPSPEEASIIQRTAERVGIAFNDAVTAAREIIRALFNADRSPKPAFKAYMQTVVEETGDMEDAKDDIRVVLQYGNQGYLETKSQGTDENVQAMVDDLGLTEDPASVIGALEKIAADPKKYGQTNADNAADLLKNHKDAILGSLTRVELGANKTEFQRGTKVIKIAGKTMNSWGVTNGLLEEVTHLVQTLKPLTAAEADALRTQILKARELMGKFVDWVESSMLAAGLNPKFLNSLIDDLYYSLGINVVRDAKGEIQSMDDFLDQGDDALREFQARTLTDPFTKRVLGQDKDFMKGLFGWHAKRRFGMMPDPNSKKGRIVQGSLQAEGDDEDVLKDKIESMGQATPLGTRESTQPEGFRFKTQHALESMLADTKGLFASLSMAKDGSVPFQNLEASIRKRVSATEYDTVLPVIEGLKDADGRVSVPEAIEALARLAQMTARVEVLDAIPNEPVSDEERALEQHIAALNHELDSYPPAQAPAWDLGAEPVYSDPEAQRIASEIRDTEARLEQLRSERIEREVTNNLARGDTESATARYTQVNPKPLDQMEAAADVMVEEPVSNPGKLLETIEDPAITDDFDTDEDVRAFVRNKYPEYDRGEVSFRVGRDEDGDIMGVEIWSGSPSIGTSPIKYSENTHFPTRKNVIGFARTYVETLPDGTKALHVFEVQSDWAAKTRRAAEEAEKFRREQARTITRIETSEEGDGRYWAKAFAGNVEVTARFYDHEPTLDEVQRDDAAALDQLAEQRRKDREGETNPYLPAFESLALKAAIQRARSLGIDKVIVSDSETAMMTEGHDRAAPSQYHFSADESLRPSIAKFVRENREDMSSETALILERLASVGEFSPANTRHVLAPDIVRQLGITQRVEQGRPTQEPGMRAAYDPKTGRTHGIMRKLTGDKGRPVDMGVHQNAGKNGDEEYTSSGHPTEASALAEAGELGLANPVAFQRAGGDWMAKSNLVVGSPIFKNPDGTPKTNATGIMYDLSKVDPKEVSTLGTREPGYHTTTHPVLHEAGQVYVYLRDGNNEVIEMTQVAIKDAKAAAKNMMDNRGVLIARHFEQMVAGTLGTRVTEAYLHNLRSSQGHQAFLDEMRAIAKETSDESADPVALSYFDDETGDFSIGAAYYPNWRMMLELNRDNFLEKGDVLHRLTQSLLDSPHFDALVKDRPLYVEDLGSVLPDAHGAAAISRRANETFSDSVASQISRDLDRGDRTAKPPVLVTVPPNTGYYYRVVTHEALHLLTMDMVETIPEFKTELTKLLKAARKALNEQAPGADGHWENYGLQDEHELIAEAFTNPRFADMLRGIPSRTNKGSSLWNRLMELIGKFLNSKDPSIPSLLDELVTRVHRAIDENGAAYAASLSRIALNDRLTEFAQDNAPYLNVTRTRVLTKAITTDRRLKPTPIRVTSNIDGTNTLEVAASLLNQPGEAERLIARENVFAKFRLSLTQSDFDAIRNAPDKGAFLPALLQAARSPEAAMDLSEKMDDAAVNVLLQHAFNSSLAPDFMDAFDSGKLGTREASMADRIDQAREDAGYSPVSLGTRAATQYRSRVPLFLSEKHEGWEASGMLRYGRMSKKAFKMDRMRKQAVESAAKEGRMFEKDTRRFIGAQPDEDAAIALVNDALGSTRNWSDPEVLKRLEQQRKDANKVDRNKFLSAYGQVRSLRAAGKVTAADTLAATLSAQLTADIEANRQAMETAVSADSDRRYREAKDKQATALAEIRRRDPEFHGQLVRFRQEIDNLGSIIANDPTTSPDLKATIDRERGLWLHRSYALHSDPKWYDRIKERHPDLAPVIAEAERFIRDELVEEGTRARIHQNKLDRIADSTVPRITEADAKLAAENEINSYPGMVEARMNEYLDYGRATQDGFGAPSYASTATPSILKRRKDIPDPIRALWGEVKDPRVNGAQAIVAAAQRVANKKFLREVVADGIYDPKDPSKPFFLIRKEDKGKVPGTADWEPVVSEVENNEASPLAGLHGPPVVHDAIRDLFSPAQQDRFFHFLSGMTGFALAAQTTLSVRSTIRNFASNILLATANGNTDPQKWRYAWSAVRAVTADLKNTGSPETRDFIADLIKRGVIHDNQVVGLMRELHDSLSADMDKFSVATKLHERVLAAAKRGYNATMSKTGDIYQAQDDFWKIISYLGEVHSLEKIYADERASAAGDPKALAELEEKIKQEAADIVVMTLPTYSHAPEFIRALRRSQAGVFFAPFVNWPAEIVRISWNIPALAAKDIFGKGNNDARRMRGFSRMAHFVFANAIAKTAISSLVKLASMVMAGLGWDDEDEDKEGWTGISDQPTPDEERAFRDHLPPWSRNATLLFLGRNRKTGEWRYMDISFTDPFDYWKRVGKSAWLAATTEGVGAQDAALAVVKDSLNEITKPFVGVQLLAGSAYDALSGKASGQYAEAPWVSERGAAADLENLARGLITGRSSRDSGKIVLGLTHVIKNAMMPDTLQSVQNIIKGMYGIRENSRVYDAGDEVTNLFGVKVATLNPMESDMFKFRAFAQQYSKAGSSVRDRTLIDASTTSEEAINNAYTEAMLRQRAALADTRRQALSLMKLGHTEAEIVNSLDASNFNDSMIGQVLGNYFEKTPPSKATLKKAVTVPDGSGASRLDILFKAYEKYDDTEPLLHE